MIRQFLYVVVFLMPVMGFSQEEYPFLRERPYAVRFGLGATVAPETFLMVGSVESHVDRFLSFGPHLQLGLGNGTALVIPTLEGRLSMPIYALKQVETSFHTGLGLVYRDESGFSSYDFNFSAGLDIDFFPFKDVDGLALGVGALVNVTTSRTREVMGSTFACAAYHF